MMKNKRHCLSVDKDIDEKECRNQQKRLSASCAVLNCKHRAGESSGDDETVKCRGADITIGECNKRQRKNPSGCLECLNKKGAVLTDNPPPPPPLPSDEEKVEISEADIQAMHEKIPWLTAPEATLLLTNGIDSPEKLLGLGMDDMIGLAIGRQHGHIRREWPSWEKGLNQDPDSSEQDEPTADGEQDEPRKTWDDIYKKVQTNLSLWVGVNDLTELSKCTKHELKQAGFDWPTIDFFALVLEDNGMQFMTRAENAGSHKTTSSAMGACSKETFEVIIKQMRDDIAEIKGALAGVGQDIVGAIKQGLEEMPQQQAGTPLTPGKISVEALEIILGKIALCNVSRDKLTEILNE